MPEEDPWQMKLPALAENVAIIRAEVGVRAAALGMSTSAIVDLKTIVSEACANVVKYAYEDDLGGPLEVEMRRDGDGNLTVYVRDEGGGIRPRPPRAAPSLKLGLPLIGALSERFSLSSEAGAGTELMAVMSMGPERT
jgi:anti-sigma regulatory factor (Ser/Thr protein kinase)